MSDCELFGDCPPVEETPVEEEPMMEEDMPAEEDMMMEEDWDKSAEKMMNPLMGQIAFLLMAVFKTYNSSMKLFRYRSASGFYDAGKMGSKTNFWQIANLVGDYSQLAIFGVAAVTQILSMAGLFSSINYTVWKYGIIGWYPMIQSVVWFLRFFAYEQEYSNKTDAAKYSAVVKATVRTESKYAAVAQAAMIITFAMQKDNWTMAQYMAMTPEEQAAWRGDEVEEKMEEEEMVEEETEETMGEGEDAETELFQF